jgi:CRP-like cAMP-binding protein
MRSNLPIKGESLAGVELFSDLDLEARQAIAERCTGFEFASGETVLNYKDKSREALFVLSGEVEVNLFSVSGKRITFNEKGAGEMVGELAAIDGQPRCAHVLAKTDCRMASIKPEDFMDIVSGNPDVARKLLTILTLQIRSLSERVFEFNVLCVANRIHVELLREAREAKVDGDRRIIESAPTHSDIASRVSTHREAVTRELSKLAKEGLLEKHKDSLIINDIRGLEERVEQSLGEIPLVC